MKTSAFYLKTRKETPADAEIISHQLMLRAGLIQRLSAGIYSWLPLGLRVLRKVENIVRTEMDKAGALELLLPAVQPAELWQESGRWQHYGPELLRIQDRHERDFCIGPTHEEVVTDLMRHELKSYKQLPLLVYQIQTKFRDEIRPRFGVLRGREFLMKDAYSFNVDEASLQQSYDLMYQTYSNIFTRLGLKFRAVKADTGSIGGDNSHEFQVLADSGEDVIAYSDSSDYAANVELAESLAPEYAAPSTAELAEIDTPGQYTIEALCQAQGLQACETIKTLIVKGQEHELVALVLRGDDDLNEIKAEKHPLVASPFSFADPAVIEKTLGAKPGSLGPVNLDIPVIVDPQAAAMSEFSCGKNENDKHYLHAVWERDAKRDNVFDLRTVKAGDPSPDGKGKLLLTRGIEVGQVFALKDKYSKSMNLTVLDDNGKDRTVLMGCYGIGVSRIVGAAIEQNHDDNGIVWPDAMAPFQIAIVPINLKKSTELQSQVAHYYEQLQAAGFEVLLDDRNERPGVMFADMDLIGIPHRLVFSEKLLAKGVVEYKARRDAESQELALDGLLDAIKALLSK